MIYVLRLVLILALSFGAVIAPDVSSASVSDMAMAQMNATESADDRCDGCVPTGFSDGLPCEGGCPVPCGSGGTTGIAIRTLSARLAMSFGVIVPVAEPLIPLGASPSVDPFPPKLPV
jgi:hypothetical protein